MALDFKPTCRYGHGAMVHVASPETKRWALIGEPPSRAGFLLTLYMCPNCGYCEMFDDDPGRTVAEFSGTAA